MAISVRDRGAASRAGGEATIDAVAVGVVRDNEHPLLGLGGEAAAKGGGDGEGGDDEPHETTRW